MDEREAIRPEVLDWMRHGTMLCEQRVAKWPEHEPYERRVVFERELKLRRFVMARLAENDVLAGSGRVWFEYMVRKARLQAAYYAGEVDRATFRTRSRVLRHVRDRDDEKRQHQAWLREVAA